MGQVGLFTGIGAVYLLGGALSLGTVFLSNLRARKPLVPRLRMRHTLICGGLFIAYTVLLFVAIGMSKNKMQVMEVAMINYFWPTATLLCSLIILRNRARGVMLTCGTLLALGGIFAVVIISNDLPLNARAITANFLTNPAIYAMAFVAALSWALYSNFARLYAEEDNPYSVPLFLFVSGMILYSASGFTAETREWTFRAGMELVVMAALPTGLAYTLWGLAMRGGNMVLLVVTSYFAPLVASVFSALYLGVSVKPVFWLACLFVVAGALLSKAAVHDRQA